MLSHQIAIVKIHTPKHATNTTTPANGGAFLTKIPKTNAANIPGEIYP